MQSLIYVMIAAVMLAPHLASPFGNNILPVYAKYLPDVLSMVVAIYVVAAGTQQRFRYLNGKYLVAFGALTVVIVCGVLVNDDQPGPVLSGLRYYLRAIPFFFLPVVVDFGERQIVKYLVMIATLSLVQVPVAIYQRYTIYIWSRFSGDDVRGTLMHSGVLTIFLISVLCVATALMLRGRLGKMAYGALLLLLLIPMSINETKVTVFLLPIGLLITSIMSAPPKKRIRVTMAGVALIVVAGAVFIPIYDFFATAHVYGRAEGAEESIGQMFTDKNFFGNYLDAKTQIGTDKTEAGRVDALTAPLASFSDDPVRLAFGLGVGNASTSPLGAQFVGRYQRSYGIFASETTAATFLVETGVLGLALVLLLHFLVLQDTLVLARQGEQLLGVIACGWTGAWIVITIGNFYIPCHIYDSVSFLPWFFSGLIAARRQRLLAEASHAVPIPLDVGRHAERPAGLRRARQRAR
ncbi:MAG TPA: hypothetical protein VIY90_14190 [Steroidobacteraceae bacterium]